MSEDIEATNPGRLTDDEAAYARRWAETYCRGEGLPLAGQAFDAVHRTMRARVARDRGRVL
jgi:hypothetical protein